jgi:hypothetical protein
MIETILVRLLRLLSERNGKYCLFFNESCNLLMMTRSNLSKPERKAYTNAVLCLQKLPPKNNATYAPGAKSRFDDFVITHIEQTLSIHSTVRILLSFELIFTLKTMLKIS